MRSRILTGLASAVAATALMTVPPATADPDAAPLPNVNAYPPAKPSEYSVMQDSWYAFTTPDGLMCAISRANGGYGCTGAIPAAPNGANVVSGGLGGAPDFSSTDIVNFGITDPIKPLPAMTRLSFQQVSCGSDGAGMTICMNDRTQTGFILQPAGSFIVGSEGLPLLERPEGTRPF